MQQILEPVKEKTTKTIPEPTKPDLWRTKQGIYYENWYIDIHAIPEHKQLIKKYILIYRDGTRRRNKVLKNKYILQGIIGQIQRTWTNRKMQEEANELQKQLHTETFRFIAVISFTQYYTIFIKLNRFKQQYI